MRQQRPSVDLHVNGRIHQLDVDADELLITTLRSKLGLTGTKLGCGTGDCGACTILADGDAVCACLLFTSGCEHLEIVTVEGLADTEVGRMVRSMLREAGGVQCGICTPGIVAASCALLTQQPGATRTSVKQALAGNICRCTGYVAIADAVCAAGRALRDRDLS